MQQKKITQAHTLREQGYSLSQIAKELKVGKTTVHTLLQQTPKTSNGTLTVVPNRSVSFQNGTKTERNGTNNGTAITCFLETPIFFNFHISDFPKEYKFLCSETEKLANTLTALFEEFHLTATPQRKLEINKQLIQLYTTFENNRIELADILDKVEQENNEQQQNALKQQQLQTNQFISRIKHQQETAECERINELATQQKAKADFESIVKRLQKYNHEDKGKNILANLITQIDDFEQLASFANIFSSEIKELLKIKKSIDKLIKEDKEEKSCYLDLDLGKLKNLLEYL